MAPSSAHREQMRFAAWRRAAEERLKDTGQRPQEDAAMTLEERVEKSIQHNAMMNATFRFSQEERARNGATRRITRMATQSPQQVIDNYAARRTEALKRQDAIVNDKRLTLQAKNEAAHKISEELTGLRRKALDDYATAVEQTRLDLHTDLMGSLKSKSDDVRRPLLAQVDDLSRDTEQFQRAVQRAQSTGDEALLDALTWAARDSSRLRSFLPSSKAGSFAELDQFESDYGTRMDGFSMSMAMPSAPAFKPMVA